MTRAVVLLSIAASFLAACATSQPPAIVTASNRDLLYQHEWELRSLMLDNKPMIMHVDARMTLSFNAQGQVAGFAAVNRFTGKYTVSPDGKIAWDGPGFALTRASGPPELMDKERAYLDALRRTSAAIASDRELVLQSADGSTALSFTRLGD